MRACFQRCGKHYGKIMVLLVRSASAGSVLGFCCVNPDGGDYGQWTQLVNQALDKWRSPFSQRGCLLSLQNHRCDSTVHRWLPSVHKVHPEPI